MSEEKESEHMGDSCSILTLILFFFRSMRSMSPLSNPIAAKLTIGEGSTSRIFLSTMKFWSLSYWWKANTLLPVRMFHSSRERFPWIRILFMKVGGCTNPLISKSVKIRDISVLSIILITLTSLFDIATTITRSYSLRWVTVSGNSISSIYVRIEGVLDAKS